MRCFPIYASLLILLGCATSPPQKEVVLPEHSTIPQLIENLGDAQFRLREAAQERLMRLGESNPQEVLEACVAVYNCTPDPEVKYRLRAIMEHLVLDQPRGFLGVQITEGGLLTPDGRSLRAVTVMQPIEGGPAEQAGIQAGDQIIQIDDRDLTQPNSVPTFLNHVQSKRPGDRVRVVIQRNVKTLTFEVSLVEQPEVLRQQTNSRERREELFETWLEQNLNQGP